MLHMLDTDMASYLIKGKTPLIEAKVAELVPSMVDDSRGIAVRAKTPAR